MADDGVALSEQKPEMPAAREAFMTPEHANNSGGTAEHAYDGYELLLDIDESVLDDYLPAPTGLCCTRLLTSALS